MASSFAAQLRTLAQNSTHELDLRARRVAHAESLLFPKEVAAKQDFETLYAICIEGFRELCRLDATFEEFERNLFSAQSIRTEREQMNKNENEALDKVLERFLAMLSGKLLLKPGVRCLEWLVRRFRVHVHNTAAVLLAILPWHETTIWRNVLSVIPKEKCTAQWKVLGMYKEEALNVPRSALVYTMTNNDGFFTMLNRYVVDNASHAISHTIYLKFWTGVVVEALIGRLDAARSGRKEILKQKTEDLLLKILPMLSDAFDVRDCPDLTLACYTIAMVLAGKANLDDRVLDTLLQAVAFAGVIPEIDHKTTIMTMVVVLGQKQKKSVPKAVLDFFLKRSGLENILVDLRHERQIGTLIEALTSTALSGIKKKNIANRLAFVERLLRLSGSFTSDVVTSAAQVVLLYTLKTPVADGFENTVRSGLIEVLQRLNEERNLSSTIAEALRRLNQDPSQLEALLGSTIALIDGPSDVDDNAMELDVPAPADSSLERMLEDLPTRTVDTTSFLAKHDQHLYSQLVEIFVACCASATALQKFVSLPIWQSAQSKELLLVTLLLRIAVGPFTSIQRSASLRLLNQTLKSHARTCDVQMILPYILTTLSDNSQVVRTLAAETVILMNKLTPGDVESVNRLGSSHLYDESSLSAVKWIATSHLKSIIAQALIPNLEECVLDASQAAQVVKSALNGNDLSSHTPSKSSQADLKKTLRHDLFDLLVSHAVATPILRVKVSIINLLAEVSKVGTNTKSKALGPVLKTWLSCDETTAKASVLTARLDLSEVDMAMTSIISPHDKDAISSVLAMLQEDDLVSRTQMIAVLFGKVQSLWKQSKHDVKVSSAQIMFDVAFTGNSSSASGAQSVLRSVNLTTDILGLLLDQSTSAISQLQNAEHHPKKKRRTSNGRDSLPPDMINDLKMASTRLTFALELIDDSHPETRPELLPALFDTLSTLKRFKSQGVALPYLHNLCLSNMNVIVEAQRKSTKPTIDVSSVRADLVSDCIITSENPQVQTTALLLSANLASIVPDRMLHSVMPIFTFMGQNMISKDDEHSVHVINQAIDKIIPALVDSLRNQNKDLVKSTTTLLASFTAAFDHIPQHRRVATYARLLDRMGSEDFAFVVIALLSHRNAHHASFDAFFHDLLAQLSPLAQLRTFQKTIHLGNDLLLPTPQFADDVFGLTDNSTFVERQKLSQLVFHTALNLLQTKTLKAQISKLHRLEESVAESLKAEIDLAFKLILSTIRDRRQDDNEIFEKAKQCLDALLALPSLKELFKILPQALSSEGIEEDLKPQVLRVLASQLQGQRIKDTKTRVAAIELLSKLTDMLRSEKNIAMKQAIVVCIDRLSEIYGRKDVDVVVNAAMVVAGSQSFGSYNRRLEVMSSLCLASMLEILKEACIPVVPIMMPTLLEIFNAFATDETEDEEIHSAIFTLIAAVASHVPFLLSDRELQAILLLTSTVATQYNSPSALGSRTETLSIMARKVDFASLITALLGVDLLTSREHPADAELEKLDMISVAIEAAPKAVIVKNADAVSQLLLAHLEQRTRLLSERDATVLVIPVVDKIENKIKSLSVQFIYKLNDTTFRPIFESWVDWATDGYDIEDSLTRETMLSLRRTSLFNVLTHFFDTLKSIVTSYASYVIPLSNRLLMEIMSTFETKNSSKFTPDTIFYTEFLNMLRSTFSNDVDGFYNTPSHFEPIASPLVSQLKLAASKSFRNLVTSEVTPTIISLAIATADTPSHHQTISHGLVQLRHSSSAAVRLASIKTFAAITADEDVGEEFIANVIGVGGGEGQGARGVGGGGSVGEVMIYVNEMLEDDDEDVEREVRKWVQVIREKTGEDVFEV